MKELMKYYNILGHIRSGFFGDVYAVSKGKHVGIRDYSKLPKYGGKNFDIIMKVASNNKTAMHEVKMLYEVNKIGSTHFPFLLAHHKCDNVNFRGWRKQGIALSHQDWTFVKKGKGLITFMENAGIGMDLYVKTNNDPLNQVVMIFQLLYALYLLENAGISHNDIFLPNIVSRPVNETNMTYKIRDQVLDIPILDGHVPVFVDFGQADFSQKKNIIYKTDKTDKDMLLRAWQYESTSPEIQRFARDLRIEQLTTKNTEDFLLKYYNNYIA